MYRPSTTLQARQARDSMCSILMAQAAQPWKPTLTCRRTSAGASACGGELSDANAFLAGKVCNRVCSGGRRAPPRRPPCPAAPPRPPPPPPPPPCGCRWGTCVRTRVLPKNPEITHAPRHCEMQFGCLRAHMRACIQLGCMHAKRCRRCMHARLVL